jgi:succinate dehydrogenase/fumarate reductase flavoprotein subunit
MNSLKEGMMIKEPVSITCDVLVLGGGGAGLRAAIAAREKGVRVVLVSKSKIGLGNNTAVCSAGLAAATSDGNPEDNPEVHIKDTLRAGFNLNDRHRVEKVARGIVPEVSFLEKCGVTFEQEGDKRHTVHTAGHSYPRQLHAKNHIGTSFTLPLKQYAEKSGVIFKEGIFISRLLITAGQMRGAMGIDREGQAFVFTAPATILATGGLGQIYKYTNNAAGATGDGYALAFEAGITLQDMEFVQFYPTSVRGSWLISYENLINHGATLKNARQENVLAKHGLQDRLKMTRDNLSRAILREITGGYGIDDGITMDLSGVAPIDMPKLSKLLPGGAFPDNKTLIVLPTTHFTIGGIAVDSGEAGTSIPGLFACGEVTGGLHGANRIAGNALAEVFVMGRTAGENAAARSRENQPEKPEATQVAAEIARLDALTGQNDSARLADTTRKLKETMWLKSGILRHRTGLQEALTEIKDLALQAKTIRTDTPRDLIKLLELHNMLLVSAMVVQSALDRNESRGTHFREDYPQENPNWVAHQLITNRQGEISIEKK